MEALERLYIRLEKWEDLKDIYSRKAELATDRRRSGRCCMCSARSMTAS